MAYVLWHLRNVIIHHEAILDIYLFGILLFLAFCVFLDWCGGLLSILASVFFGCLTLNVRSDQIMRAQAAGAQRNVSWAGRFNVYARDD